MSHFYLHVIQCFLIDVLQYKMGAMAAVFDESQKASHPLTGVAEFEAWMRAEQRRINAICKRMMGDEDEANSAAQDVFLKAYHALERQSEQTLIREPGKWLTRIAVNTCLDRLRSKKLQFWRKRPAADDESRILSKAPSSAPDVEQKTLAVEIDRRIHQALQALSPRQRAVFTLRHYCDNSNEEIAGILELDLATVKTHLARALEKLRGELKDLYGRQTF